MKAWSSALNRRDLVASGFTLGCKLRNRRGVGVLEAATLQPELLYLPAQNHLPNRLLRILRFCVAS